MGTSFDKSSSSMLESSQLELSGASPALLRSEERANSRKRTSKVSNFTQIRQEVKNNSRSRKTKAKHSDSELQSDDDQPSGSCYFVGEKSNVSISSSVNKTVSNRTNQDVTPPTPSKGSSVCACVWIVTVISLLLLLTAVLQDSDLETFLPATDHLQPSAEHWKQVRQSVTKELASLKIQFPNQTKSTWRVIGATLKSPLHPLPDYPGVLLLVSPSPQSSVTTCLATKLLETSSGALLSPGLASPPPSTLMIRATDLSPDTAKRELTEWLHSKLGGWATAAVLDLASLPPTAALTLHAFADNSNAPYKQAVLVLTVAGDLETEQTGGCKMETRVEKLLAKLWLEQLGVDKFSALVSRIVVSVVELQPESQDVCGSIFSQ